MKSLNLIIAVLILHTTTCIAADTTEKMIPANKVITVKTTPIFNEVEVLKEIRGVTTIPVLYPTIVKLVPDMMYFVTSNQGKEYYEIIISSIPNCIANYCAYGEVIARFKSEIDKDDSKSMNYEGGKLIIKEVKKIPVDLANNIKGFYTPAYTAANYADPKIQWKYKDVLYTISWPADQKELIQMANSAILAEMGKIK